MIDRILSLGIAVIAQTQPPPNGPIGYWMNPAQSVVVEISPCGPESLCGHVRWASPKAARDAKEKGTDPLEGVALFRGFSPSGDGRWRGRLFIPDLARTSRAELRILSSYVRPEEEEDSDAADIHFQFTDAFLEIQRTSQLWAKLSGPAMVKVTSTYALKLYEIGMQRYQMDYPSLELDIDTLRKLLNVPEGAYKDFGILRTRTIDRAIAEVNQLAPFRVAMPEDRMKRRGRKVEAVTLEFSPKDEDDAAETFLERERHSAGRRARRAGKVEQLAPAAPDPGPLPDADDVNALWAAALHALKGKVPAPLLAALEPLRVEDAPQGVRRLVLRAGSAAVADTASRSHWPTFKSALASLTNGLIGDVTFEA